MSSTDRGGSTWFVGRDIFDSCIVFESNDNKLFIVVNKITLSGVSASFLHFLFFFNDGNKNLSL